MLEPAHGTNGSLVNAASVSAISDHLGLTAEGNAAGCN